MVYGENQTSLRPVDTDLRLQQVGQALERSLQACPLGIGNAGTTSIRVIVGHMLDYDDVPKCTLLNRSAGNICISEEWN